MPDENPVKPEDQKSSFIFTTKQLRDNNGRMIVERHPVWGVPPKGFARFMAPWTMTEMTVAGPVEWQFEVPLPDAENAAGAFAQMGEAYKKELPNQKAKLQEFVQKQVAQAKSRILVGSQLPPDMPPLGKGPLAGPGSPFDPRKKSH